MNAIENERMQREEDNSRTRGAIVEVGLLLEPWLLTALESAASEQGMTAAGMVRRLLRDFLYYSDGSLADS